MRYSKSITGVIFGLVLLLVSSCSDTNGISQAEDAYHIPKNFRLTIVLDTPLSSNTSQRGDTFQTKIKEPLLYRDALVLPKGTMINGLVKRAQKYVKMGDKASLVLLFDQLVLPSGNQIPLLASLDTRSGSAPIKIEGKALQESQTMLGTAVMGALMEKPAQASSIGESGLMLGAMLGSSAVLLSNAKEVRLPVGSEITISLDEALMIPQEQ
jgi:hypothetical protein